MLDLVRPDSPARRFPARRWLVALVVACGLVAGGVLAVNTVMSGPDTGATPPVSATQLVHKLRETVASGYSGTLVADLSLDLPVAVNESTGMPVLLLSGAHTLRYWYGGPDRQRIALQRSDSEADVFRIGSTLWQWDSATNVAVRSQVPSGSADDSGAPLLPAPITYDALTPQSLASRTAAAAEQAAGTTEAKVEDGPTVAGRPTYRLTLTPARSVGTRTGSVRIEVDTQTSVPLGVQVYARGQHDPSIDVTFSAIRFAMPADAYFQFTPPRGSKQRTGVTATGAPTAAATAPPTATPAPDAAPASSGWAGVTSFELPADAKPADVITWPMLPVSGTWGTGYLMQTYLLCVLITSDGQVLSGSVNPSLLYAAVAASH